MYFLHCPTHNPQNQSSRVTANPAALRSRDDPQIPLCMHVSYERKERRGLLITPKRCDLFSTAKKQRAKKRGKICTPGSANGASPSRFHLKPNSSLIKAPRHLFPTSPPIKTTKSVICFLLEQRRDPALLPPRTIHAADANATLSALVLSEAGLVVGSTSLPSQEVEDAGQRDIL